METTVVCYCAYTTKYNVPKIVKKIAAPVYLIKSHITYSIKYISANKRRRDCICCIDSLLNYRDKNYTREHWVTKEHREVTRSRWVTLKVTCVHFKVTGIKRVTTLSKNLTTYVYFMNFTNDPNVR
jgi:hypothetical protein